MAELTAEEMVEIAARNQLLVRNVFSTPEGKELLELWNSVYVMCDFWGKDDRDMHYAIGQRDLIIEIKAAAQRSIE